MTKVEELGETIMSEKVAPYYYEQLKKIIDHMIHDAYMEGKHDGYHQYVVEEENLSQKENKNEHLS